MSLNPGIKDWTDRRVWIIGASTGIGAALADALVARGARLAVSARRSEPLQAMVQRHGQARHLALPLDIADADSVAAAHRELVAAWGGCDLVIFMAGTYQAMRAWELDLVAAHAMIATNLSGTFNGLACVIPQMLQQGHGSIALVASVAGYRGLPNSLVYGPTKAAIINLAEALYLDLQPKGLAVHVINPGFVATPLTAQNRFPMPHLITAQQAALHIIAGIEAGEFEIHFPRRFSLQLKFLRLLPYRAYFSAIRRATGLS